MIKAIILKEFTDGILKGESFNDQLEIKTISQLDVLDLVGKNLDAIGSNYKIISVSLWCTESFDYITRKQAEYRLTDK